MRLEFENILFIFEGKKPEIQILKGLQKFYFPQHTKIVPVVFGGEIYQLYRLLSEDEDLDLFNLILERNTNNKKALSEFTRTDFAEIYLFFDYDGHSDKASDSFIQSMLEFFNEETNHGKLYISYPMIESLKHFKNLDTFKSLAVASHLNINYKQLVHNQANKAFSQVNKYRQENWDILIKAHLMKMNYIVNENYEVPAKSISPMIIFSSQLQKFIQPEQQVAVLSGFPGFLFDYFGNYSSLSQALLRV